MPGSPVLRRSSRGVRSTLLVMVLLGSPVALSPIATAQPASGAALTEFPPNTPAADLPEGVGWGTPDVVENADLGDGGDGTRTHPVQVFPLDAEVGRVDPGSSSACELVTGSVLCWGSNQSGQIGTGNAEIKGYAFSTPVVTTAWKGKNVTAVSVGGQHACAVVDYRVYCWGSNLSGQLGINNPAATGATAPVPVFTGGALAGKKVSAVSAGTDHTCVIAAGAVYCWGAGASQQIGDGAGATRWAPVAVLVGDPSTSPVSAVTAGNHFTCALKAGRAYCWGANVHGEAGTGKATASVANPSPIDTTDVLKGLTVKSISAGTTSTCAIAGAGSERKAYCWGQGAGGRLGNNSTADKSSPVAIFDQGELKNKSISTISTRGSGGCVTAAGRGYCWGQNESGQLGNGGQIGSLKPVPVDTTGVLSDRRLLGISTADNYTLGLAVTPRTFLDVPSNYAFYDDITWAAGSGITQGNADNSFKPTSDVDRQSTAAFLYRYNNPGTATPPCSGAVRVFDDVPKAAPFCGAIEALVAAGVVAVPVDKKFHPGTDTTRGTMADWMYRSHHPGVGDQVCTGGTRLFFDVPIDHAGCGNIEWLALSGITTGFDDGTFRAGDPVHRDAMAAFLHRARGLTD